MDLREQLQHTLGSSYTLQRELGGGGMARVFVASETRLRRNVVVKVLTPELAAELSVERFEREIQLAASLQQANIVPVLSAGDMGGVPYYTMPYVEGESLRALLAAQGARPISDVISILHDVARALSYAHAHGVVHRDIKPDNVLLSHGTAVVTDFGIAKAISASRTAAREAAGAPTLTQVGASIGTPAYMAPEQAAGDPAIDHRADIYAFGCLAYELLTGRSPFAGRSAQALIAAHLTETPTPVQQLRAETPSALATLVSNCLAKRAVDRPASANELLDSLAATVTPSVADAATVRPARGPGARLLVAAVGLVVCVALAAGGAAWWRGRTPSTARVSGLDKSIAVLPFANLSDDRKNDYMGEGLAEDISNALANAGLRVIPASARTLPSRDPLAIAKQLGVASVLDGTVQRDGERLRITVRLLAGADGSLLWSQPYTRDFKDAFAVQDEIAHSVAAQLRVTLAGGAATKLAPEETSVPAAHDLYWQALWQWNRRTARALHQAINLFEQAIARDSGYARAYAGIGMAYAILPVYDDVPADETTAKALAAARRALQIDSTLPEARAVVAYANAAMFENAAAEHAFASALSVDTMLATTYVWHSLLLSHVGKADEAIRESQRARMHDPASLVIQQIFGLELYSERRYAAADSVERAVLALDPTFDVTKLTRGAILADEGRFDDAIAIMEPLSRQPNLRSAEKLGVLAYTYARAGRRSQALATLARLPRDTLLSASGSVAAALDALGWRDSAVAMFRRAVVQHDPWLLSTGRSAPYDALRKDPRLSALFARIESPK